MRLAQRLQKQGTPETAAPSQFTQSSKQDIASITARLHPRILDRLDLAAIGQLSQEELGGRLRAIVEQLVAAERLPVNEGERDAIVASVVDELTGLGPLEVLLKDPTISDVLVNGCDKVYVERNGKLVSHDIQFRDDKHLIHTIQRMVAKVGRRIDESSPMVDARLPDGSRVNAVIPPLAVDGPALSIRRFGARPLSGKDLVQNGALSEEMLRYLHMAVHAKCSILIAGGTGAGKTTLLNALSSFVPQGERIITVEDAAELRLAQPHVVRLEARPPNLEGRGEVTIRDLVRNALRMRPDRIVVGEVRGAEVLDMLQAMNTGHEGSLATIHANSAEDAISRLMTMLGMSGTTFSEETMATLVARAVHLVVHVTRMQDGKRRVSAISEVTTQEGSRVQMNPVFSFERIGLTSDGTVLGRHEPRNRSALGHRFKAAGLLNGAASGEVGR
ncbi:MAG: CpaF family protein [Deltaproteobacteria bacterium]|nr:CpaF family protein [Deltaproteobacteria bacterium]